MSKMANQVSCLIVVMMLQLCMVSCSNDFFNYFHAYYHNHKRQSTTDAVPSSTPGLPTPIETDDSEPTAVPYLAEYIIPSAAVPIPFEDIFPSAAVPSAVEDIFPSAVSFTEENDEIYVTQKSYSRDDLYSYQQKWITAARVIAVGGGIFLFISLICCVGCCCRGGFRRERTGMVIGQSEQSLVPQIPQTVAVEYAPPLEHMPPPPPPYSEEKSQTLPYYQTAAHYPPEMEQQFPYPPNLHNPPTAPPPYQDRY